MFKRLLIVSALFWGSLESHATEQDARAARGHWVSIDGLRPDHLRELIANGELPARFGFRWLYNHALKADRAEPAEITLTAPSHVSSITCSPPSQHGIVANAFIVGDQKVNGFSYPIKSETMWQAAKRQGKKVISIAYVGADGNAPERTPDIGLSYPDTSLMGKVQTLNIAYASLASAIDWTTGNAANLNNAKEYSTPVILNQKTNETRALNFLFVYEQTNLAKVIVDTDKDLTNGIVGELNTSNPISEVLNAYYIENDPNSPLVGRKRRVYLTTLENTADTLKVYVSAAAYTKAFPADFAKKLDDANIVFPGDYISTNEVKVSPTQYLVTGVLTDNFFTDAAVKAMELYPYDILLFYQPLIDSFGHKYEGEITGPLVHNSNVEVTSAYVKAFQQIDKNLNKIFQRTANRDIIMLMGDHGMEPIKKQINLAAVLNGIPADRIVISGALALIYSSPTADSVTLTQQLQTQLMQLSFNGQPVGGEFYSKADTVTQGTAWQYGEAVWASTSGEGFWYTYNPTNPEVFIDPPITGMHGHSPKLKNLGTGYYLKGRRVPNIRIPLMRLLDAAPTFSMLMGMAPPANCMGHSILK